MHICLQCGFPGYTGGLVIGSYNGSGFEYVPAKPIRGYRSLNIFCAQDESIWDRDESREYSYGWSENFGTGPDGERLSYVSGNILESGPDRLVLTSRNRGGCYQVDKRLLWPGGAKYVAVWTLIRNLCDRPVHFDFWTGDDPWIGRYHSSEGDVGYTQNALVRVETRVPSSEFAWGGVYDLGNSEAKEKEGGYSGIANFILLRPERPKPDRIYFANRFAHSDAELQPGKPLDNKSMLALNLGWTDVVLKWGQEVSYAYVLGIAQSSGEPQPPRLPDVPDAVWWTLEPRSPGWQYLHFEREHVELTVSDNELAVDGVYQIQNDADQAAHIGILYPFPIDLTHPTPSFVEIDGKRPAHVDAMGTTFPFDVPARASGSFRAVYRQNLQAHSATYIITSARHWSGAIGHAEFVIRYPRRFRNVWVSYPADTREPIGELMEYRFARSEFVPRVDVTMTWE